MKTIYLEIFITYFNGKTAVLLHQLAKNSNIVCTYGENILLFYSICFGIAN